MVFKYIGRAIALRTLRPGGGKDTSSDTVHQYHAHPQHHEVSYHGASHDASRIARGHNPYSVPPGADLKYHHVPMSEIEKKTYESNPVVGHKMLYPHYNRRHHSIHDDVMNKLRKNESKRVTHTFVVTQGSKPRTDADAFAYIKREFPAHHDVIMSAHNTSHPMSSLHTKMIEHARAGDTIHAVHIFGPESSSAHHSSSVSMDAIHRGQYPSSFSPPHHQTYGPPPHHQMYGPPPHHQTYTARSSVRPSMMTFSKSIQGEKLSTTNMKNHSKVIDAVHKQYGGRDHFQSLPDEIQIAAIKHMKEGKVITHYHDVSALGSNKMHMKNIADQQNARYVQHISQRHPNLSAHTDHSQRQQFYDHELKFLQQGYSMGPAQHIHGAQLAEAYPHMTSGDALSKHRMVADIKPLDGHTVGVPLQGAELARAYKKHYGNSDVSDDHRQLIMQHLRKGELVTRIHHFARLATDIPNVENHYIKHYSGNKHGKHIDDARIIQHLKKKEQYIDTKTFLKPGNHADVGNNRTRLSSSSQYQSNGTVHRTATTKTLPDYSPGEVRNQISLATLYDKHYGKHDLSSEEAKLAMHHLKQGELITHIHTFKKIPAINDNMLGPHLARLRKRVPATQKHIDSKHINESHILKELRNGREYTGTRSIGNKTADKKINQSAYVPNPFNDPIFTNRTSKSLPSENIKRVGELVTHHKKIAKDQLKNGSRVYYLGGDTWEEHKNLMNLGPKHYTIRERHQNKDGIITHVTLQNSSGKKKRVPLDKVGILTNQNEPIHKKGIPDPLGALAWKSYKRFDDKGYLSSEKVDPFNRAPNIKDRPLERSPFYKLVNNVRQKGHHFIATKGYEISNLSDEDKVIMHQLLSESAVDENAYSRHHGIPKESLHLDRNKHMKFLQESSLDLSKIIPHGGISLTYDKKLKNSMIERDERIAKGAQKFKNKPMLKATYIKREKEKRIDGKDPLEYMTTPGFFNRLVVDHPGTINQFANSIRQTFHGSLPHVFSNRKIGNSIEDLARRGIRVDYRILPKLTAPRVGWLRGTNAKERAKTLSALSRKKAEPIKNAEPIKKTEPINSNKFYDAVPYQNGLQ
jgi:hypothetical protein